jgi:glycosyltransferase involved in cell wall biosynthesis
MLVSIICPTFNRAFLLRELLESLIAQEYRPFEVVVVDDCSTDNTEAMIKEYFAAHSYDQRVSCVYDMLRTRHGAQVARNRGVDLAQGDALMFVDSDDVIASDGLQTLARYLNGHAECSYVYGKVVQTDELLTPLEKVDSVGSPFRADLPEEVAGYHWHTMGALYRRECVSRVGKWNEELTGSQDWEFQARVKICGGVGEYVDTVVGYWRRHDFQRVGTKTFRADYVLSIMKACASVLDNARRANACNSLLEYKIAKRLLRHALEWGASGYPQKRSECVYQAAEAVTNAPVLRAFIRALATLPSTYDATLLALLKRQHPVLFTQGASGKKSQ